MSGVIRHRARLGQGKGPEVDLIVSGTPLYTNYETLDGFPAVYDDDLELFCYARVKDGSFESTGVSVNSSPPPGVRLHANESDSVRAAKIEARRSQLERDSNTDA